MEDPPAGRRREGAGDRASDRRRPVADRCPRLCRARQLHPRLIGAAAEMADPGLEERRNQRLRPLLELSASAAGSVPTALVEGRGRLRLLPPYWPVTLDAQ